MTKESVHYILDRGVKVMGIDAIGFDPPVAKMFERKKFWEAHRIMREREYYHLENMCNLHEILPPYHSFTVSVSPIKWRGAALRQRRHARWQLSSSRLGHQVFPRRREDIGLHGIFQCLE
jgi:kynurenine formamidase